MSRCSFTRVALPALSLALSVACASKPVSTDAAKAPVTAASPSSTRVDADRSFDSAKTASDSSSETLPANVQELNRKGYLKDAFFDFDHYEIRVDQRAPLASDAEWLKRWPTVKIRIEGHCDERGTAAYNAALGEKRAAEVKEYLATLGVERTRLETISYGEERPFAEGHDESAWARNRRDHLTVTAR